MIDEELLKLLRCPHSGATLVVAPESLVLRINEAIERGEIRDQNDQRVFEPLDAAVMVPDASHVYAVRGGIVCMVADEAISLKAIE